MATTLQPASLDLIVSIDFGTHGTGFSFALRSGGDPRLFEAWPDQSSPGPKTRTALLYKGKTVAGWGCSALSQHAAAVGQGGGDVQLVERFKLALADEGQLTRYTLPRGLNAVTLAADFLGELRKFAMAHLRSVLGSGAVHADRIQWCITVPAIWSNAAKNKVRQAAVRAGLITKLDSEALLLILEPEAAALHASRQGSAISAGDVFMVLDAGGGTVDITLHRVVERAGQALLGEALPLAEAAVGSGGFCGSTYVDERWEAHCRAAVGSSAYELWRQECPAESLLLQSKWEAAKCVFDCDSSTGGGSRSAVSLGFGRLSLQNPAVLAAAAEQHVPLLPGMRQRMGAAALQALRAAQGGVEDRLLLPAATMRHLFDPVVEEVLTLARSQLQRGRDAGHVCGKVLLVGGFAESPYLQRRVRAALGALPVIVPSNPGAAVLQGAVLFGRQPGLIGSRCSRLSYGVATSQREADSDVSLQADGGLKRFWHAQEQCFWVSGVFHRFVCVGQVLGVDESVTNGYCPVSSDQKAVTVNLYATDDKEARIVDAPGMHKVGTISMELPAGWSARGPPGLYKLRVRMRFGLTELEVEATDLQTGCRLDTSIVFAHAKLGAM